MFIGAVAKPLPEKNFSGKIWFRRVSEDKTATRQTWKLATTIVDWQGLCSPTDTGADIKGKIIAQYPEFQDIPLRLSFSVTSGAGSKIKYREVVNSKTPAQLGIALSDIILKRSSHADGEVYDKDCECDGKWLWKEMGLGHVMGEDGKWVVPETPVALTDGIGPKIREAFSWVDKGSVIKLQMDGAGGHGGATLIGKMKVRARARRSSRMTSVPRCVRPRAVMSYGRILVTEFGAERHRRRAGRRRPGDDRDDSARARASRRVMSL